MTVANAKLVDVTGDGNCGYYAYSVSLMYFLRNKQDSATTNDIFTKLQLSEAEQAQLNDILATKEALFSRGEQNIIETILGPSTRKLAAAQIHTELQQDLPSTDAYTSLALGIKLASRNLLQTLAREKQSKLQSQVDHLTQEEMLHLLSDIEQFTQVADLLQGFTENDNYMRADIYKTPGIVDMLRDFLPANIDAMVEKFYQALPSLKASQGYLQQAKERQNTYILNHLLEPTIHALMEDFFNANDKALIKAHVDYLRTNGQWASESALYALNRAIQGERKHQNEEKRWVVQRDTTIETHLYHNGVDKTQSNEPAQIILNNRNNAHWVSFIPESFLPLRQTSKIDNDADEQPKTAARLTPANGTKNDAIDKSVSIEASIEDSQATRNRSGETAGSPAHHSEPSSTKTLLRTPPDIKQPDTLTARCHRGTQTAQESSAPCQQKEHKSGPSISLMVIAGFTTAIGIAAVALAFTVLHAASFGILGLLTASVGAAVCLSSIGLFALSARQTKENAMPAEAAFTAEVR